MCVCGGGGGGGFFLGFFFGVGGGLWFRVLSLALPGVRVRRAAPSFPARVSPFGGSGGGGGAGGGFIRRP